MGLSKVNIDDYGRKRDDKNKSRRHRDEEESIGDDSEGSDDESDTSETSDTSNHSSSASKGFPWRYIGWIVLAIIVILCGIGLVYFFSYRPKAQQAEVYNEREHLANYETSQPQKQSPSAPAPAPSVVVPEMKSATQRWAEMQEARQKRESAQKTSDEVVIPVENADEPSIPEPTYPKVTIAEKETVAPVNDEFSDFLAE